MAVLVTDITDYRSIQLKGTVVTGPHERTPGDMALFHHHVETFCAASPIVGLDPTTIRGMFPDEVVAIVLDVDDSVRPDTRARSGPKIAARR